MPTTLFSVLIANYNNGKYLEDALQSIFVQTYTNWEIILVDDASTDNSKDIYQKYINDTRIHIYYNDKNYGCGYTKHRCAELANGEICGFLDPDDALTNTALEDIVNAHLDNKDASMIYSDCYICDNLLKKTGKPSPNKNVPNDISLLESGVSGPFHFETFKKAFYNKTDGINAKYQRSIDWDLFYKMEEVGKLLFLKKKLYYYRTNTNNNISLGDNSGKALYWKIIITADACMRRNLNAEDISYKLFDNACNYFSKYNKLCCDYEEMVNNFSFKLGKFITAPFRWIKQQKWFSHK